MATASIQGVGVLLSMAKRFAWPAAARTDNRSGINAKLSPRSGSALASAHSVAIFCFDHYRFGLFHCICWRPYHVECTGSLLPSEVKRHRARLVLGWGTAWEDLRVLTAFYLSTFKPKGNECCHVNVVILDSGNTPAQHAQCHTTPAAQFLEI